MATKEDYIKAAEPALNRLLERYPNPKDDLHVSDVVDEEGHQYVNLVQEGGGVLGIALLGYTYVLEQMGIRFMKMAGTSAGAINTMMLAALGEKQEMKSLKILELLSSKNLFDFVDGGKLVRTLVRNLITSTGFFKRILIYSALTGGIFVASLFAVIFLFGRAQYGPVFLISAALLLLTIGIFVFSFFWSRGRSKDFSRAEFGLNPGKDFYDWVSNILHNNGIKNLADLRRHIEKTPPGGFRLRRTDCPEDLSDLNQPKMENFLVLVASDITNQIKVEFPRMWSLYWPDEESVNPAGFVRASMAVPVFFRPFTTPRIEPKDFAIRWSLIVGPDGAAQVAPQSRFLDGGIISNFPINVFYNPTVAEPRLPTFGVVLEDSDPPVPADGYKNFFSFVGAMFSTLRFHYDKEFLIKHADFKKTIGEIDVRGINWLNFNLSSEEKIDLFRRGAEAAADFFLGKQETVVPKPAEEPLPEAAPRDAKREPEKGFDWNQYKRYRNVRKRRMGF
ncbi:MAG: patatin-like phospholipase family protein [Saprospiraceae bacterium]|nr:patatin-like phospholipase family protein [Saprospiraceae bacterium]